ncbi:MAG: hypothetical protein GTN69_05760, partial [Armatimonadetes bacterium]|nr:hypothetical protein [Armatimonadota bacterium]
LGTRIAIIIGCLVLLTIAVAFSKRTPPEEKQGFAETSKEEALSLAGTNLQGGE